RASSTKSWLWHQRLSHLNFDTINDLAKNDLVAGLPKFKYHKEHLCPSCEQGKSKRASHPPKPVPNSRQRLHLLHIKFKNQVLEVYFDSVGITHQMSSVRTPQQNGAVERRNRTLVEAARTMLIFSHIGKLGAKGDIGFFIAYSADSCAYKVYNRQTKKIMETINVSFDELSAMAFEQHSSKPGLQCMTSGQISLGLDLTYAPSTITKQQPTKGSSSDDVDELNPNAMVDGNTFVKPFATSSSNAAQTSSSQNVDPSNMYTFYQPYPHEWTKDHPLEQNVKEAMTDPAWIESMQKELLQFKRMDVWVFVPIPDNISPLTLKWIFKNKHDEEQTV
nr:integrase, catalytic region, zinc finger, CCHC-type, peptidase aspartic, catalytic [Tanacetum cinerariifolium]